MKPLQQRDGLFILRDSTAIHAPIDRCFQLSTCLALVQQELGFRAVSGRTTGFVQAGDTVRWEGWQLGLKHFHVTKISGFDYPTFLQDTMLDGRFQHFQHDHHLRESHDAATSNQQGTVLEDELRFALPFGPLGHAVARYIMVPHIRNLMRSRFARIKRIAESEDWRNYLPAENAAQTAIA